ncbi:MAG: ABC transporter permease [Alphaproteobacteria bacterium]|nr:ABC transporter permease [Alphaproteobacteria bacterium]
MRMLAIFRRELTGYFITPVAYVFIIIFLLLAGIFTFYLGNLYERGQADLTPFFLFHPWLYLFLIPAITMRLWAEERRSGTIELLMTMPIAMIDAVLGKFLAAWAFTGIALALTVPVWITANVLGEPDNGVVLAGYIGSLVMAGAYLAVGACVSSVTRNQVIAFVVSIAILFLFVASGSSIVLNFFQAFAPRAVVDVVSTFSFLTHYTAIAKGVLDLRDIVYFGSVMALALFANAVIVELKKAG